MRAAVAPACLAVVLGWTACFDPPAPEACSRVCAADDQCPGDLTCSATGLCETEPGACAAPPWVEVATSHLFACARNERGLTWCWGDNRTGASAPPLTPRAEGDASLIVQPALLLEDGRPLLLADLAVGQLFACGVRLDAPEIVCWGHNFAGQVTTLATEDAERIQPLTVVPGVTAPGDVVLDLEARRFHACALVAPAGDATSAEVRCWGGQPFVEATPPDDPKVGNAYLGATGGSPVVVTRFEGDLGAPVQVALGNEHTCVRRSAGTVECWGSDLYGQLGRGDSDLPRATPAPVEAAWQARAMDVGAFTTYAIAEDDGLWSWGVREDTPAALGRPPGADGGRVPAPFDAPASPSDELAAGSRDACVLRAMRPWCWGTNDAELFPGVLGAVATPTPSGVVGPFARLEVGAGFACGTDGQTVTCWGRNEYGQARPGSPSASAPPSVVLGTP